MITAILVVFSLYFLLIIALMAAWHKCTQAAFQQVQTSDKATNSITVIVPFRNEKENLSPLINSLSQQTLADFEVLLVDDHSDDGSYHIVQRLIEGKPHYSILSNRGSGKKMAITTGVHAAKGNIIVTTDADCVFQEQWLQNIDCCFSTDDVKLGFGPVLLTSRKNHLFEEVQVLEFMSVVATGAATFQLGYPMYCNAANLAFRSNVFKELNGYDGNLHVASGDDEFLMHKVLATHPTSVRWMGLRDAVVRTRSQSQLSDFLHQRVRWAGKWKYSRLSAKILALGMLMTQLATVAAVILAISGTAVKQLGFALLGKLAIEYLFLFSVGTFFLQPVRLIPFAVLQVLYPTYVLVVGVLSNFLTFRWKGRRLKTSRSAAGHF